MIYVYLIVHQRSYILAFVNVTGCYDDINNTFLKLNNQLWQSREDYMIRAITKLVISLALLVIIAPFTALAAQPEIHGFFRAGAAISLDDTKTYQGADKNGDFSSTHFGLNFSNQLDSKWRLASQIFAAGYEENYNLHIDWAYATLQATDDLKVNFGKIKYPNLLYSEVVDVGNVYLWTAPPQELYNSETEGSAYLFMESFVGASAVYSVFAGDFEFTAQALAGNGGVEDGSLDKMIGGSVSVNNEIFTLKAGFNQYTPKEVEDGDEGLDDNVVSVVSGGAIVNWNNVLVIGEYAKGTVDGASEKDSTGMYATVGYVIGSVTPNVTFSKLDAHEGREVIGVGAKYQMSSSSTFKIDYFNVTPDAEEGEESESLGVIRGALDFVF